MTGYASADGAMGNASWSWELKSVNGRSLEVRCRLPSFLENLEPMVRARLNERFKRGTVNASLTFNRPPGTLKLRLNPAVVDQLEDIIEAIAVRIRAETPRLDGLLGIKGVVESVEEEEAEEILAAREEAILATLDAAIAALAQTRSQEGERLAAILSGHLDTADKAVKSAHASAALQPQAIHSKLAAQIAALLDSVPQLSEERIAQEAALLAARADVREELDRLTAHLSACRGLVNEGGAIGRRLDFLCQELNREANTICSKSTDMALTRAGLDLKTVIDQFREQVQNVE
jgi:uncharacterized protein (TIGR00255 family)